MDVVIEVRDARIPMSTSHPQVEIFVVYCVFKSKLLIDISAVFPGENNIVEKIIFLVILLSHHFMFF